MPIRWRLSLWFIIVLAAILLVSGLVARGLLLNYLNNEVDESLWAQSARVHGTLGSGSIAQPHDETMIHSALPIINEFSSPGIYIQIMDSNRSIVAKSDNLGSQELPVDPVLMRRGLEGQVGFRTLSAGDGASVRVMVSPLYLHDQTLILEIGRSLRNVETTMNRVGLALGGGVLAALLLASLLAYMIVRTTLSRVRQITRTARNIEESQDLGRKVNYRGPKDEINELATTFDRIIGRLHTAFQSQKQFVADASHELRTPLTVIRGNTDLLKRNLPEKDREECLTAIRTETQRISRIVDDLLVLAEVEGGRAAAPDPVSLKEVIMDGYTRAQRLAENRKVALDCQEDLFVKGDVYLLKQVVGNLVDNAVKYTPDSGAITLSLTRDNGWARIDVSDTGVGIPREHLSRIFDRFYRVDKARSRAAGGTGLGLAIVKETAESLGGRVSVVSEPGKGSTFTVWLKL